MSRKDWAAGVARFNEGRYWEAHHEWEQGWVDLPVPEKQYVQALIQSCGVFLHLRKGRYRPAQSLCRSALGKFGEVERLGGKQSLLPRIEVGGLEELLERLRLDLSNGASVEARADTYEREAGRLRARIVEDSSRCLM